MHKKNAAKEKQPEKRRGSADLLSQSANAEMLKRLRQKRAQLFRKGATVDLGEMPTREEKASSLKPEVQQTALQFTRTCKLKRENKKESSKLSHTRSLI